MNKKDTEREIAVEASDFCDIIRTDAGRKVMLNVLEESGYFEDTFSPDPEVMKHLTSRRSVGVWLYNKLREADEGQLNNIIREHNKDG